MFSQKINTNRIEFLNTYIDNLTAKEAICVVDKMIKEGTIHYVVSPNSDIIVKMQDDSELKTICDNADLILTDGQMLVKISRWLGNPIKERVCMTDFVWDVCDLVCEKEYKLFLLGGREDILELAVRNIKTKYPDINIVDSYSPPIGFDSDKEQLLIVNERIKSSKPDVLIVFLGCPKQEKFIYNNMREYNVPISITMGGCVDFLAGKVKRAPLWMQQAGLEWFYRFLQEPRRMFRRYFIDDCRIFKLAYRCKHKSY